MDITNKIKKAKRGNGNSDFRKLKLLITVVNRNKAEFYMDYLTEFEVNFQMSLPGQGTAKSDMLNMLGLKDADKSVLLSVLREDAAERALQALDEKFKTLKNGKGIAFTVPMTSVIGVAIYRFLSNHRSGGAISKENNENGI